jgi:hypothetical protein
VGGILRTLRVHDLHSKSAHPAPLEANSGCSPTNPGTPRRSATSAATSLHQMPCPDHIHLHPAASRPPGPAPVPKAGLELRRALPRPAIAMAVEGDRKHFNKSQAPQICKLRRKRCADEPEGVGHNGQKINPIPSWTVLSGFASPVERTRSRGSPVTILVLKRGLGCNPGQTLVKPW